MVARSFALERWRLDGGLQLLLDLVLEWRIRGVCCLVVSVQPTSLLRVSRLN